MDPIQRGDFESWYFHNACYDPKETALAAAEWGRTYVPTGPPPQLPKLSVLVDEVTHKRPLYREWLSEVAAEKQWAVSESIWRRERDVDERDRVTQVMMQMRHVDAENPDCVLVVGNVARFAGGFETPDDQGPRCEWSHLHLAGHASFSDFKDDANFTRGDEHLFNLSRVPWTANAAFDGRFNSLNPRRRVRKRPVFSIDFAFPLEAEIAPGNPSELKDEYAITHEMFLLDEYLRRNLAYRRGSLTFERELYVCGSVSTWGAVVRGRLRRYAAGNSLLYLQEPPGARTPGVRSQIIYGHAPPFQWLGQREAGSRCVLHVSNHSWGASRMHPDSCHGYLRRLALVSLWGSDWSTTVARGTGYDMFLENRGTATVRQTDVAYGDPTVRIL